MRWVFLILTVAGCANQPAQPTYVSEDEERCRYEVKLAMAGVSERSIADSIDAAVRQNRLVQQCLRLRRGS